MLALGILFGWDVFEHVKDLMALYVLQTAALDGETDLKTRVIPPACMGIDYELLHKIKAGFL